MTHLQNAATQTSAQPRETAREWSIDKIDAAARLRGVSAEGRLSAVFEVLDDIYHRADRDARTFVETFGDRDESTAKGAAGARLRNSLDAAMSVLAEEANLRDSEGVTSSLRILAEGATNRAIAGDLDSARRAQAMADDVIARHRVVSGQPGADPRDLVDFDSYADGIFG